MVSLAVCPAPTLQCERVRGEPTPAWRPPNCELICGTICPVADMNRTRPWNASSQRWSRIDWDVSAGRMARRSASLLDSSSFNRVVNLVVSNGVSSFPATSTVVANAPGALAGPPGAVDFAYTTNAGSNGAVSLLQNGDARTILNTDGFAGNNNGGADGSALAWAIMDPVTLTLAPGTYSITLTGTVKGNTAQAAPIPFSVSQTVQVIGQSCGPQ